MKFRYVLSYKKIMDYLLLLSIGLIWGSQFIFTQSALQEIPPITMAATRILLGMLTLSLFTIFLSFKKKNLKKKNFMISNTRHLWTLYIFISIFEASLPFFLVAWGQQYTESSVTAILMSTIPIFTLFFSVYFFKYETWQLSSILSVLLGFIGIVILMMPHIKGKIHSHFLGELAILSAAMSFAWSIILLKKLPGDFPLISIRNILGLAAIPMIILSIIIDKPWQLTWTIHNLLSLSVLGVFCAGIVSLMYIVLINRTGPIFASLTNYIVPLVGVILGHLFAKEQIQLNDFISIIIIFMALMINQFKKV